MTTGGITKVDIAICTWNRQALLARTFRSLGNLEIPSQVQLSFLIVDNNSTDQTPQVIEEFRSSKLGRQHNVVALHESRQGHTFSRNRAVASAAGELMIWTDDDVNVPTDWVAKYVQAANASPEYMFWGGAIKPKFLDDTPAWIAENWEILKGCFAFRDLGDECIELTASRLPYGANFAIRTKVQKQFSFDCDLGRRGDVVLGEDELDLMRRLIGEGHRGAWVPDAGVEHLIPQERATEKYVFDNFVGHGRTLVAKGQPWHENAKRMKREFTLEHLKYKAKRRISASPVWVGHMVRSALAKGQFEAMNQQ